MKYGAIRVRKVEPREEKVSRLEQALDRRRFQPDKGMSSQGLNYTLLSALSIGTNYAYINVPWSQAIGLTLAEARLVARDTLDLHPEDTEAVISVATVDGTLKSQQRQYYVVTIGWLWDMLGHLGSYHQYVETIRREG